MTWERFEQAAARYDDWYETPRGRRATRAERALLAWLLEPFAGARTALDVGCGTGQSTAWLAERSLRPIGLDRAPAMLARAAARVPGCPLARADAGALPLGAGSVDLVAFVTTLEFLAAPADAMAEAVRVARRGVVVLALNRWSLGGLSRRVGPQARGALLSRANDLSPPRLEALARRAAGRRLVRLRRRSALLPAPCGAGPTPLPLGDVLGIAVELTPEGNGACSHVSARGEGRSS